MRCAVSPAVHGGAQSPQNSLFDALIIIKQPPPPKKPPTNLNLKKTGTGKTLLARAVAHHTDCTFIRVSGSELVQKYIGEGSRMVRELFVMAR